MEIIRAIDICAGAGGWACAADRLEGKPIKIVAAIDFAQDCLDTYKYNHDRPGGVAEGAEFICDDVRKVDYSRFKNIDLVLGGIPCESISVVRQNYPASNPELFDWIQILDACLKAVEIIQPRHWVFEDIIQVLNYLPDGTPYRKIDSSKYSPQARKRAYVGKFPKPAKGHDNRTLKDCLLPCAAFMPTNILKSQPNKERGAWYGKGFYRQVFLDKKCPTILTGTRDFGQHVIHFDDGRRRPLMIPEQAKAQGFPSDYIFIGNWRRMAKMIGQAIQIDTGAAILKAIMGKEKRTE